MMAHTYLLVNFLTIAICLVFSFHPKISFHKHFSAFIKASVLVAVPFILWDVWFTSRGIWWFDHRYTIGIAPLGLPIEEWLFFICIPFSCVFTYFCMDKFFDLAWSEKFNAPIVWIGAVGCLTAALIFHDRLYTCLIGFLTATTLVYLKGIARARWIGKASWVYLILMLGFLPVNGVLTGTGLESPIVNYDREEIVGIRMLTIPIEDSVYGYTLFLLNIYFFTLLQRAPGEGP